MTPRKIQNSKPGARQTSGPVAILEPLYGRIGGAAAIHAAVDAFYSLVLRDALLKAYFKGVDIEVLKSRQRTFFTQALGGPARYRGADLKNAHAHLAIEQRHFNRVASHLSAALASLGVETGAIEEVLTAMAPLGGQIVNSSSGKSKKNKEQDMAVKKNGSSEKFVGGFGLGQLAK